MMGEREKSLHEMTMPELQAVMEDVVTSVEGLLPPETDFIVLACPFGQWPLGTYISNADRRECVSWLRQAADFLEGMGGD
jgi:hypothetical protein